MTTTATTEAALPPLEDIRGQIEQWRKTRPHRNVPMPDVLWAAAVAAAEQHGLYPTARFLRVDYGALKARVEASSQTTPRPAFVELRPASTVTVRGPIECVIEVEGRAGARRLRLTGLTREELPVLVQLAWSATR
jgi:hypothetical protein